MRRKLLIFVPIILVFLLLTVITIRKFTPPDENIYTKSNWLGPNFILGWQFASLNEQKREAVKAKYGEKADYDLWARDYFVYQDKEYYFIQVSEKPFYIYDDQDEVYVNLPDNYYGNMLLHENYLYFEVNLKTLNRLAVEEGEGFPFIIYKWKYRLIEYRRINLDTKEIEIVSKEDFQQLYNHYKSEVYDKRFE